MLDGTEKCFPVETSETVPIIHCLLLPKQRSSGTWWATVHGSASHLGLLQILSWWYSFCFFPVSVAEIRSCVLKDVDLFRVRTKKLSLGIKGSIHYGFPDGSVGKESACNTGDPGSILGSERSVGEGIGYPLQYS